MFYIPPGPPLPPPDASEEQLARYRESKHKHRRMLEDNFNILIAFIITTILSIFITITVILIHVLGFFATMHGYSIISLLAVAFGLTVYGIFRFLSQTRKGD